jgi:hypothetical protein
MIAMVMALFLVCSVIADEGERDAKSGSTPVIDVWNARIASSTSRASLHFDKREIFSPNGIYRISIRNRDQWLSVDEIEADKYLRSRSLDLTDLVYSRDISVRIKQEGGGAAHIDSITLNGRGPSDLEGLLARKLSSRDNDVIDSYEKTIEVNFSDVPLNSNKPLILELTARIESEIISKVPFQFPPENLETEMSENSAFYTYEIGSNRGKLTLDGELTGENLRDPFFAEYSPTGSGHPDATTYGWVRDDGENLYVAIDFLGDNTMDGGKDYSKVYVNTLAGLREFKITAEHTKWGHSGFTYTERVIWQHKIYEFAIPLDELGMESSDGQQLAIAFAAYGTCAYWGSIDFDPPADPNGVTPDAGSSGTQFIFSVIYKDGCNTITAPTQNQVWIDLDGDDVVDTAKAPFLFKFPGGKMEFFTLLTLAALAMMIWIFRARIRRASLLLVSIMAVAVLIAGSCPGSSDGDEPTTEELYDMTWINSNPTVDWSGGEDFAATVKIVAPAGNYTFSFLFVDDEGNDADAGTALGDQTLTIE